MNRIFEGILSLLAIALLSPTFAVPADAHPLGVNSRQSRQHKRIFSGVQNGSLTGRETRRLAKQQQQLAKQEAKMRASGDGLSKRERAKLEHEQNQLSHNIYRQKHDEQAPQQ